MLWTKIFICIVAFVLISATIFSVIKFMEWLDKE